MKTWMKQNLYMRTQSIYLGAYPSVSFFQEEDCQEEAWTSFTALSADCEWYFVHSTTLSGVQEESRPFSKTVSSPQRYCARSLSAEFAPTFR